MKKIKPKNKIRGKPAAKKAINKFQAGVIKLPSVRKPDASDRDILRQLSDIFGSNPEDVVKSLERFKRELADAKEKIGDAQ